MLCDLYQPYFSGAATQAARLASGLVACDQQAFVLAGRYAGTVVEETVDGVAVKRVKVINSGPPLVRPISLALSTLPALIRHRNAFDILHVHAVGLFSFLPLILSRLLKKKTVIKMTLVGSSDDPAAWPTSRVGHLMRLSFKLADRVVSISTPLSENYRRSGLDVAKLRQLPQGVDIDRFHPVAQPEKMAIRERLGLRPDAVYLCFVGSLKQRKGADIIVDAFTALAKDRPDLHLLIVGPDAFDDAVRAKLPYAAFANMLKERLAQAGVAERVVFTGRVDPVELYLQASDIFVFPSRREGFPSAVIEAMAVGLPCVLASLGGVAAEICGDQEAALIVDGDSPEEYARQISALLDGGAHGVHLGLRARARVVEEYAIPLVTARYIDLYCEMLSAGPGTTPA